LCQQHADAVFGADHPAWQRLDAKTQREITEDWLRSMTILAHGGHRPLAEVFAEIAEVNQIGAEQIRIITPLMPGELRDLTESARAQSRLHARETTVHALASQILLGWYAEATGQTRSEVLQRLSLLLNAWLTQAERQEP
jgi:hypothetical protein